ncbi:MAG: protein-glutamate O-methyltransferase CheR [Candidatus Omnitrophica bacterium]|nr:protein-glutamate O-methyltransferase CheR [Candidatus Omnitrophota bacterium]
MLEIADKEFSQIREIMYRKTGVALKDTKKPLVVARLRKRLEELKLERFAQYVPLLERDTGAEMEIFINALTTNETYFFRHTKQFNFLYETILPEMIVRKRESREVRIWSAASSTGEEPFSIALVCKSFFKNYPGWKVSLIASDINTEVIGEAKEGVYSERSIKEVPDSMKNKYFVPWSDSANRMWPQFQLSREIISSVRFVQHNLLLPFKEKDFDVIFIRNVMIYFDGQSKQKVADNVVASLVPGGYLFISLSESLNDVKTGLRQVYSAVYQK